MQSKCNTDIRKALKAARVAQWELAEEMGVNEFVFSRRLRKELSPTDKRAALAAVERLAKRAEVLRDE